MWTFARNRQKKMRNVFHLLPEMRNEKLFVEWISVDARSGVWSLPLLPSPSHSHCFALQFGFESLGSCSAQFRSHDTNPLGCFINVNGEKCFFFTSLRFAQPFSLHLFHCWCCCLCKVVLCAWCMVPNMLSLLFYFFYCSFRLASVYSVALWEFSLRQRTLVRVRERFFVVACAMQQMRFICSFCVREKEAKDLVKIFEHRLKYRQFSHIYFYLPLLNDVVLHWSHHANGVQSVGWY